MQTSFHDFYATCQENEENGAENLRLEILSLLLKCMLLIESVIIKENEKYSRILSKRSGSLQCLTFFWTEMDFQSKLCLSFESENVERK